MDQVVCAWCQTVNKASEESCIACGAPVRVSARLNIESRPAPGVAAPLPVIPAADAPPASEPALDTLKQAGEQVEQIYNKAVDSYGLLWRTLGEALAIASSAFMLGMLAGAAGLGLWGMLAGIALGVAVGMSSKIFWWHLVTPLAVLVGAILGLIPQAAGTGKFWPLLLAWLLAVLSSRLGHRPGSGQAGWERLNPWLGAAAGWVFALMGIMLGWSLTKLVDLLRAIFNAQ